MTTTPASETTPHPPLDLHELLDAVLSRAVSLATDGAFDQPRPGQRALSHRILDTMLNATSVTQNGPTNIAGKAPTGVGKSLAYLCPAFLCAAVRGERTVVSTESKSLQRQIVDKDAPTVIDAVTQVCHERDISIKRKLACEIYQGWSNYVCLDRVERSIADLAGTKAIEFDPPQRPALADLLDEAADAGRLPSENEMSRMTLGATNPKITAVGDNAVDDPELAARLLAWSVRADDVTYHQGAFPGGVPGWREWGLVSVDSGSCRGKVCPHLAECIPTLNRRQAGQASVVVTNHSMIATQATKGIPVVINSKRLGPFDHTVFDECHTLPGVTRQTGAVSLDERTLRRYVGRFIRRFPDRSDIENVGDALASELDTLLHQIYGHTQGELILTEEHGRVLGDLTDRITLWIKSVQRAIPRVHESHSNFPIYKGIYDAGSKIIDACVAVEDHRTGWARWIERLIGRQAGISIKASPVDVSGLLANRVYVGQVPAVPEDERDDDQPFDIKRIPDHRWIYPNPPETDDEGNERKRDREEQPYYRLSSTHVSATITPVYGRDSGTWVPVEEFESPFAQAYANSVVYRANGHDPEVLRQCGTLSGRKFRLDVGDHEKWCAAQVVDLVRANGGAALVLSAKSSAGKLYVEALRQADLDLDIYSQWDGSTMENVKAWRHNPTSVMVGTKSLMTGVDAPGQTCSLVIIDRPPRAPKNPVDQARVDILINEGMDRWDADRFVYAVDAALMLEQEIGRLIRSISDTGMVAVLDPRLVQGSPASYPGQTLSLYNGPLYRFGDATVFLHEATHWLAQHRQAHPITRD